MVEMGFLAAALMCSMYVHSIYALSLLILSMQSKYVHMKYILWRIFFGFFSVYICKYDGKSLNWLVYIKYMTVIGPFNEWCQLLLIIWTAWKFFCSFIGSFCFFSHARSFDRAYSGIRHSILAFSLVCSLIQFHLILEN